MREEVRMGGHACVACSAAVVGGREQRDQVALGKALKAVHHALVRPHNHLHRKTAAQPGACLTILVWALWMLPSCPKPLLGCQWWGAWAEAIPSVPSVVACCYCCVAVRLTHTSAIYRQGKPPCHTACLAAPHS